MTAQQDIVALLTNGDIISVIARQVALFRHRTGSSPERILLEKDLRIPYLRCLAQKKQLNTDNLLGLNRFEEIPIFFTKIHPEGTWMILRSTELDYTQIL